VYSPSRASVTIPKNPSKEEIGVPVKQVLISSLIVAENNGNWVGMGKSVGQLRYVVILITFRRNINY
jgi:hypothetical protein